MKSYPKIIIQRQPNRYACYPTCVSILTGIPLETLFKIIGHDGSNKKGFEYNEVALASLIFGWSLIPFDYKFDSLVQTLSNDNLTYRMILSIKRYKNYHAVAWDGKSKYAIDPLKENGLTILNKIRCNIIGVEILVPIERREMNFLDVQGFKDI